MKSFALLTISALFGLAGTGKTIVLANDTVKASASIGEKKDNVHSDATSNDLHRDIAQEEEVVSNHSAVNDKSVSTLGGADTVSLAALLKEKIDKNEKLAAKLKEREALLQKVEERVEQKIVTLEKEQLKLSASLERLDRASSEDIVSLIKMYQAMKPTQAGPIFNAMAPSFAAGFLTKMNAESAALILANMDTEKAYSVSLIIAGSTAR